MIETPGSDFEDAVADAWRYLRSLPKEQAGRLRTDDAERLIQIQVTHGADHAQKDLEAMVGSRARIEVETVVRSLAELQMVVQLIRSVPGLRWTTLGVSWNNRVTVGVPGDAAEAEALIRGTVADDLFEVYSVE